MADKDEFKFDDDDTFPETDLSGAFTEGEQAAAEEPDYPMTIKKSGGSKTRLLLLLLLLVVAGGGGYYYLMMDEPEPQPQSLPQKVVAPAPKPAVPAAPPESAAPAGGQSAVAVSPPPPAPAPAPAAVAVAPPAKPPESAPAVAPAAAPAPAKPAVTVAPPPPKPEAKAAPAPTPAPSPATATATVAKPAETKAAPAAADGPWMVEAGTYLNASALKSAEKKIRGLGYEPQVSSTQKSVRLTRLRLGTFSEGEVKEALAYARGVAPDAFALRSGDMFTVYAGTFASQQNIRELTERLVSEGVRVEEEPVEVKRTISLLRFGGFADQAAATEAAAKARKAGIAAEVVKPR